VLQTYYSELLNIDINSNIAMVLNYSIINVLWQKISNGNINLKVGENSPTLEILETKDTYFISFYNENIFVKVISILVE
jgi:hypothetical protein|tara:strand:+ start:212 stop:448 length:237 start_codon:yes stop_codon:yes gene_type:complete